MNVTRIIELAERLAAESPEPVKPLTVKQRARLRGKVREVFRSHARKLKREAQSEPQPNVELCQCCGLVAVFEPGVCPSCLESYYNAGEVFPVVPQFSTEAETAFNPQIVRR